MFSFVSRNFIALIAITIVIENCFLHVHSQTCSANYSVFSVPGEQCNRPCDVRSRRICNFHFTLEYYQSMGVACGRCDQGVQEDCNHPQCIVGDGWDKGVMSINRKIPGPAIHVCKDDIVIVDVDNRAHGTAASLHWHGVHMKDTPFMDGVPFVTQCPIMFSNIFRYKFRATEPGTQFYHSHSGHHKANGQYGALIIREPRNLDPASEYYDFDLPEHHMVISDWLHVLAEQIFPGVDRGVFADSIVINGRGVKINPTTLMPNNIPPTIFYVRPGSRYRFRLINSVNMACPISVQIEQHDFSVIASDSFNIFPEVVDTLVSNSGERYDFVLETNHTGGDFWLRASGYGTCLVRPTESYALIRYITKANEGRINEVELPPFPNFFQKYPTFSSLNHPNATCSGINIDKCIIQMQSLENDNDLQNADPDYKFFLGFDNYQVPNSQIFENNTYRHFANFAGNATAVGAINNFSLIYPDYALLTQPERIDESQFCDNLNKPGRCSTERLCSCIHRIKVRLNSIVELIIVDETESVIAINHPFHLHGYRFMVTGIGKDPNNIPLTVEDLKRIESANLLQRYESVAPPFKDTVSIPSRGYAIVRLRATNPGFWLMHCHYGWHLAIGMGLVFQVGEPSEMVKAPAHFPKCGNYLPAPQPLELCS